jgi:aryl-alcohol dehydrogenase-like predicted oxidoreductase
MYDAVSCIIPGASHVSQVESNVKASGREPLTQDQIEKVRKIYDKKVKPAVHHLW